MTSPSSLHAQLDHYLRALPERSDHPEERQDLGTFLTWLLRRSGYTIRLAPFHYEGPRRRVSKGRYQAGVDLVASRPGEDGNEDLFLFVLKPGDVGRAQWRDPKGIVGDLNELGDTEPASHERWLPANVRLGRAVIVVAHNGEFDEEALAQQRRTRHRQIEQRGFGFEWWSAPEIIARALAVLGKGPDDQLFPPTIRPFYGALLDGLETSGHIERAAVERLLAARLPGPPKLLLHTLTELSLFAAMIAGQPRAREEALLDLFDTLIALLPRCAAAIVSVDGRGAQLQETLADLLTTLAFAGERLTRALEPLADTSDSLALAEPSEQINWPLRSMWVLRNLTLSARAAAELVVHHRAIESRAKRALDQQWARAAAEGFEHIRARCLQMSASLATQNLGAIGTALTDDQLVEYAIIWRTWLDDGRGQLVKQVTEELLSRLVLRRRLGYPGPALYQRARTPMHDEDVRTLAEAWTTMSPPPSFEDGGSTLLPAILVVASTMGIPVDSSSLAAFKTLRVRDRVRGPVHPQSWSLPEDASRRWYAENLNHDGICHVHEFGEPQRLIERIFELHAPCRPSPMSELGFECIDAMAWVYQRTRPPLRWLLDALPKHAPANISSRGL